MSASLPTIVLLLWCCLLGAVATDGVYHPPNAVCEDFEIPLTVSTPALVWKAPEWDNNYDLTDFVSLAATRPSADFPLPMTSGGSFEGNVTIAGTFCSPKQPSGGHKQTVLLATHGLGFDGR